MFLSYLIIGALGYYGMMGTLFNNYFIREMLSEHSGQINQNCLDMFQYSSVLAFVVRLAIFMLLFSTYPMLNLFLRTHLLNLLFQNREVNQRDLVVLNLLITIIPLSFAIVYYEIGTILAFTGAFCGFVVIYCLPVMCYLKKKYTEITNPILAEAIAHNQHRIFTSKQAALGISNNIEVSTSQMNISTS